MKRSLRRGSSPIEIGDTIETCLRAFSSYQDDTDTGGCGNDCDMDYHDDGAVGFSNFGSFVRVLASPNSLIFREEPDAGYAADFPVYMIKQSRPRCI